MREVDQGRRAVRANPQSRSNILAFVCVNLALLPFASLMRDEWVELQRKDPALYYAYAVRADPPLMERALDALPAQLTNRENDAMAQVLSTGKASVFAPPAESAAMPKLQEGSAGALPCAKMSLRSKLAALIQSLQVSANTGFHLYAFL
jgi:hypothetical protein